MLVAFGEALDSLPFVAVGVNALGDGNLPFAWPLVFVCGSLLEVLFDLIELPLKLALRLLKL